MLISHNARRGVIQLEIKSEIIHLIEFLLSWCSKITSIYTSFWHSVQLLQDVTFSIWIQLHSKCTQKNWWYLEENNAVVENTCSSRRFLPGTVLKFFHVEVAVIKACALEISCYSWITNSLKDTTYWVAILATITSCIALNKVAVLHNRALVDCSEWYLI